MSLELEVITIEAQSRKRLSVTRSLFSGQELKLELGEEKLEVGCPVDKTWSASVMIEIQESDV